MLCSPLTPLMAQQDGSAPRLSGESRWLFRHALADDEKELQIEQKENLGLSIGLDMLIGLRACGELPRRDVYGGCECASGCMLSPHP